MEWIEPEFCVLCFLGFILFMNFCLTFYFLGSCIGRVLSTISQYWCITIGTPIAGAGAGKTPGKGRNGHQSGDGSLSGCSLW